MTAFSNGDFIYEDRPRLQKEKMDKIEHVCYPLRVRTMVVRTRFIHYYDIRYGIPGYQVTSFEYSYRLVFSVAQFAAH